MHGEFIAVVSRTFQIACHQNDQMIAEQTKYKEEQRHSLDRLPTTTVLVDIELGSVECFDLVCSTQLAAGTQK